MKAKASDSIRRVGILFSGGPAPAANAVISAATSFLDAGREVIGIFQGYQHLQQYERGRFASSRSPTIASSRSPT